MSAPTAALRALLDDHEQRYGRGEVWRAASEAIGKVEERLELMDVIAYNFMPRNP